MENKSKPKALRSLTDLFYGMRPLGQSGLGKVSPDQPQAKGMHYSQKQKKFEVKIGSTFTTLHFYPATWDPNFKQRDFYLYPHNCDMRGLLGLHGLTTTLYWRGPQALSVKWALCPSKGAPSQEGSI